MSTRAMPPGVGIIGYGSMGAALAGGFARAAAADNGAAFFVYAKGRLPAGGELQGAVFTKSLAELVKRSGIIILAVRPEQTEAVLRDAVLCLPQESGPERKSIVSVAAGVPLALLRAQVGERCAAFRVMPNTLVEVGKGLFGLCAGPDAAAEEKERVRILFSGVGTVIELEESLMNAFTALAGCGPGFLFHIMDALCEAGVSVGLTREASRAISATLLTGCGTLAETTGRHPVILREQGTSPAGMTITGLNHLDRTGVRGHLIDAVKVALQQGVHMDTSVSPS